MKRIILPVIAVMGLSLSPSHATEICETNGMDHPCAVPETPVTTVNNTTIIQGRNYSKALAGLAAAQAIDFTGDGSQWGLGLGFHHHEGGAAGAVKFDLTETLDMKIFLASDLSFDAISGGFGITGNF